MFTLELLFLNEEGKSVKISIDDPRPGVTSEELEIAMDAIVEANVFTSAGGNFVSAVGGRIIERHVTEIDLP
ncbi:DUF2922 domain-containing protein [Sutcliffiella halmapala]|uniref:DUF2922 domain-containing protein n=1 Tax=Sutcliffiella halmapala TaxID=79882 RepID=UPI000994D4AA|nr:DUF2922 domain-containing protein [Sutcliffiella halmapala]